MKIFSLVLFAACAGPSFQHVGSSTPLSIERIELTWSNVYLVTKGDAAILVDSGSPQDKDALDAALAARHVKPSAVVITHAHADHAGLARWLQTRGAKIILGSADVALASHDKNDPLPATGLVGGLLAPLFMFEREPFTPDVAVEREMDLGYFGFPELQVVPTPGHTPGSLVVVAGTDALTGDLFKGGYFAKYFVTRPSEHYYQADPAADHRAVRALLDRGVTRFYLGHGGPVDAADVRDWVATADEPTGSRYVSMQIGAEGSFVSDLGPRQLDGVLHLRYGIGGDYGYVVGLDARAGSFGKGFVELDAHPMGLAIRRGDDVVTLTGGLGIGGLHGTRTTRAVIGFGWEASWGPVRYYSQVSVSWGLSGPTYTAGTPLIGDEYTGTLGFRIGRDRRWGKVIAGRGPYLALVATDIGGNAVAGIALGFDMFAGD